MRPCGPACTFLRKFAACLACEVGKLVAMCPSRVSFVPQQPDDFAGLCPSVSNTEFTPHRLKLPAGKPPVGSTRPVGVFLPNRLGLDPLSQHLIHQRGPGSILDFA